MKVDIQGREDVARLISEFYDRVRTDESIGFIFNDIAAVDWDKHLPIMIDFWEGILFQTAAYRGNAVEKHIQLNQKIKLKSEHFDRWLSIFNDTVDSHFEGEKAILAKQRAQSIATVIRIKIQQSENPSAAQIPVLSRS